MKILRFILFPVVPVYYLITWLRNKFYDKGWLSSKSYDFPIICVGNLSVGGTGKTPMIEYLIRLLQKEYQVATLSRGYGRQTKGFVLGNENSTAVAIGDEPFQFFEKFEKISVAVDENRQRGISKLLQHRKNLNVILLDDAFQHRKVKAGLNILLTTYDNLYVDDIVLPSGNLREPRQGRKRADIIIVTKCPDVLDENNKEKIINRLKPLQHQSVYFSKIAYSEYIYTSVEEKSISILENKKFTLVTGIANAKHLVDFLVAKGFDFEHLNYSDHHKFTDNELKVLKEKELIITTEKDYMRLKDTLDNGLLYYLPIETEVANSTRFNQRITKFMTN